MLPPPERWPTDWSTPRFERSGLPETSDHTVSVRTDTKSTSIAAPRAQPCRRSFTSSPNVKQSPAGITRMATHSRKLERAVGFSKGWAEFTLKNPPPLVPSCLMAICEAAGPRAAPVSCAPSRRSIEHGEGERAVEGLHHALAHQEERQEEREREEHVERGPEEIDPEVAEPGALLPNEAPDEGHHHGDARRGRDEVLHREAQHLGQVRQGRLPAVGLPVGVRHEADRRVERDLGRGGTEAIRIQGQEVLQPQQAIEEEHPDHVEDEDRERVALPAHVLEGIDAEHPEHPRLEALDRHGKGLLGEDPGDADPHRIAEAHDGHEVEERGEDGGHCSFSGQRRAKNRYPRRRTATTPPAIRSIRPSPRGGRSPR
jgi:hypothetical protein